MPSEFAFRFSTYLSLMLSCLCLGFAEWDLLPEVTFFTLSIIGLLLVSFFLPERFLLDLRQANFLGLGIGILAVGWIAFRQARPAPGVLGELQFPANLLPYVGPVLMLLIPAKLFRPKHVGDWWAMQGAGLASVGLASALTDDPFFAILMTAYAIVTLQTLVLFYYRRASGSLPPLPGHNSSIVFIPPNEKFEKFRKSWSAWSIFRWAFFAVLIALPIFYLSPRSSGERWGFAQTRLETGFNAEQMLDLTRTGDLQINREIAFEVTATYIESGELKDDLSLEQYWRGISYNHYENGRWQRRNHSQIRQAMFFRMPNDDPRLSLPELGPDRYQLEFRLKDDVRSVLIASPIDWVNNSVSPVRSITRNGEQPWLATVDGGFIPTDIVSFRPSIYRQLCRNRLNNELSEPFELSSTITIQDSNEDPRWILATNRSAAIRKWTLELVNQWINQGKLPASAGVNSDPRFSFRVDERYAETIAKLCREYLAESGQYRYSFQLKNSDKDADPVEDFLFKTKTGHCERFASALALMLRSIGIPCQFMVGFRGCERTAPGQYAVRQEHAHAWVEVLISRPVPKDFEFSRFATDRSRVYYWLNLDPTPSSAETAASSNTQWWQQATQRSKEFFSKFIVDYDQTKRQVTAKQFLTLLWNSMRYIPFGVALIVFGLWAKHRWSRWKPKVFLEAPRNTPTWFLSYLAQLQDVGLMMSEGQTPREFAEKVTELFRGSIFAQDATDVPHYLTSKFYRVRYAGIRLQESEEGEVQLALQKLESALRSLPRNWQQTLSNPVSS